jgi:hypothetical protein
MLQLTSKSVEGRIPDISKGDFEFMGAIIDLSRSSKDERRYSGDVPHGKHEYHDNGALRERWEQLRREIDTLVHPTLMIHARVQRGKTSVALGRLVTMALNEKLDELVVYKGVGCSC